jgi:hypothetical protein
MEQLGSHTWSLAAARTSQGGTCVAIGRLAAETATCFPGFTVSSAVVFDAPSRVSDRDFIFGLARRGVAAVVIEAGGHDAPARLSQGFFFYEALPKEHIDAVTARFADGSQQETLIPRPPGVRPGTD